jgi:hypothetical protein
MFTYLVLFKMQKFLFDTIDSRNTLVLKIVQKESSSNCVVVCFEWKDYWTVEDTLHWGIQVEVSGAASIIEFRAAQTNEVDRNEIALAGKYFCPSLTRSWYDIAIIIDVNQIKSILSSIDLVRVSYAAKSRESPNANSIIQVVLRKKTIQPNLNATPLRLIC